MSSSYRRRQAPVSNGALAAAALCLAAARAGAASWDLNPRLEVGGTVNDNYRLAETSADRVRVSGALVDAQFAMRSLTPRSELTIVPRVHSIYFPHDGADRSTDGFLDLDGEYRTQKSAVGATAQYADENVISSELLPANFPGVGLGEIVGGTSGRVNVYNRRRLARVAPLLNYDFTPRRHLHLDAEYLNASFNRNLLQQMGFRNAYGSAGMAFDVSPRATFTVRGVASRFEPDGSPNSTARYGIETQWDVRRSRIANLYLRLGAERTAARTAVGTLGSTGAVGGAGISCSYQITQFVLDAVRDLAPSAAGAVAVHDELRFRMLRGLRPRLSGFVGVRAVRLRGAEQKAIAIQGSDYVAGSAGLELRITRNYRLSGTYDYTWQHFQGEPHAAANAVALSIIYQPVSRFEPLPLSYGVGTERHE